jgi:hypothetical protein
VFRSGRHFPQIPGPTNVPDRVLRAIDAPTIDHRGPDFAELGLDVLEGLGYILRTPGPVIVYPASGTGAWETALVTAPPPGDDVIAYRDRTPILARRNAVRRADGAAARGPRRRRRGRRDGRALAAGSSGRP